ncbi:YdcF family protein [Xanthovirga aplysinae]|uniref:YdcF family protein n=1 Tax=Xanthovirga aplysinae TaxID=2529853 RepID=UPI00165698E6|nr:YdcF family protein [Xanthovirga aplysinae]
MFLAYITKRKKLKKFLFSLSILLLVLFSNKWVINELLTKWEIPAVSIEDVENYEIGIVLTGVTNLQKSPKDRTYFNKGADRIIHAIDLYKRGKIKKILISGGSGDFFNQEISEAKDLARVCRMAGIPQKDLILEEKSRNTHENARNSALILKENYQNQKLLLITSAFHMRRAKACFEHESIKVDTFSTDFYTVDQKFKPIMLIPNSEAIYHWRVLLHELLGMVSYKLAGYI